MRDLNKNEMKVLYVPFSTFFTIENGTKILAYDTFLFKAHLMIYRSPLYAKMDSTLKWKIKAFHFPRGPFSAYISRPF